MIITLKRILLGITVLGAISFVGCAGPAPTRDIGVPIEGKSNVEAAVAALELHKANVIPLSASGSLKYTYFENGKPKDEHLDAKLRFAPPRQLFFNSQSLVGEAMRLGSNNDEFWFMMKPKEISKYWWGNWSQLDGCTSNLLITPESMLDALGMVSVDSSWLLIAYKGRDALVKIGENGMISKKIFVNRRGYVVSRIEYYDNDALMTISADMDDYKAVGDGSPVPTKINITAYDSGQVKAKIDITLKNPKFLEPARIGKKLFVRPEPKGIKDVYRMGDNCEFYFSDTQ